MKAFKRLIISLIALITNLPRQFMPTHTNSILNHGKAHFENALKPAIFKISFSMFRIGIGANNPTGVF